MARIPYRTGPSPQGDLREVPVSLLRGLVLVWGIVLGLVACSPSNDANTSSDNDPSSTTDPTTTVDPNPDPADDSDPTPPCEAPEEPGPLNEDVLWFQVSLDGVAQEGIRVQQGGSHEWVTTDCRGNVLVPIQERARALGPTIIASHPEARIRAYEFESPPPSQGPFSIELTRFSKTDNPRYAFQHPGTPSDRANTSRCGHCHEDINDAWYASSHRKSASNPRVLDHYQGTNSSLNTRETCEAQNGRWELGKSPGTDEITERCFVATGAFQTANPQCANLLECDDASNFAGCADCHAPSINGQLGGRDLLEARDIAYEFGVHCDVCHRVESVKELDSAPGVAERLSLLRPSERSPSQALGTWFPLTFGPRHDVPNPRMGAVKRDHYQNGTICSGCHELDQEALSPNQTISSERWPTGKIPIQSTFSEWRRSPFGDKVACNACHMPPNPKRANSSHLESQPINTEGISAGFIRPTGSLRHHSWVGPRTDGGRMLQLAATLQLEASRDDDAWRLEVSTRNVGPGHALPTGEPSRHLLLEVRANCGDQVLKSIGGDTIPDYGGFHLRTESLPQGTSLDALPLGTVARAIAQGDPRDYDGIVPFERDGRLSVNSKGLFDDRLLGQSELIVDSNGARRWSEIFPDASHYFIAQPQDIRNLAGLPGAGFARVTKGSDGTRFVPHYLATDIASDNRLSPGQAWQSLHLFDANCDAPIFDALLWYRDSPASWMHLYGWTYHETLMTQARWTTP